MPSRVFSKFSEVIPCLIMRTNSYLIQHSSNSIATTQNNRGKVAHTRFVHLGYIFLLNRLIVHKTSLKYLFMNRTDLILSFNYCLQLTELEDYQGTMTYILTPFKAQEYFMIILWIFLNLKALVESAVYFSAVHYSNKILLCSKQKKSYWFGTT